MFRHAKSQENSALCILLTEAAMRASARRFSGGAGWMEMQEKKEYMVYRKSVKIPRILVKGDLKANSAPRQKLVRTGAVQNTWRHLTLESEIRVLICVKMEDLDTWQRELSVWFSK